ncbi:MAG: ABC transporter ATP-binding protein [Acetivibrio sp.]
MKKLLRYLKDYKKETILAPLFKMLEASFELLVPLVMAYIIDVGITEKNKEIIVKMGLILVLLGVIGLVCSLTAQYYSAKAAVGFATKLRHGLFSHMQQFSYQEIDEMGSSTMITRITSDINQVQSGVNLVLRLFLRSPFIVFGAMIMAFTIDPKAALVFVIIIPLLSLVVFGIMMISIPLYKKVQKKLEGVLGITRENLSGVRVIRAFNMEEKEKADFDKENKELLKFQIFVGRISALMNPITYVIVNGGLIALIWTGAIRVNLGVLTQGQVIALINYMSQILVELIKLANLIITVTKAIACGNRVESVFEMKSSMEDKGNQKVEPDTEESVVFDKVSFSYPGGGETAIEDISFHVKKGQVIGIIGGTGSGKTTLVNLIARFYDVDSGKIHIFGKEIETYSLSSLRSEIAIVPQKASLFRGTIKSNLLWGKQDAGKEEMMKALEIAQAKEFVEKKEKGLEEEVLQDGKNFSGGQKQRLTIARALIKNSKILILDDSTSALDFLTEGKFRGALKKWKEEKTIFIVSQRIASIQYADQILVLEDGQLEGIGTHEFLLKTNNTYREIYNSQIPENQ